MFYIHADTQQQLWEPPEAMSYQPPPGRDEMGNKLAEKKPKQKAENEENDDSDDDEEEWEQKTDEFGNMYFQNKVTNESSWEAPPGFEVDNTIPPLDPKIAATESARLVINYLKNRKPEVDPETGEEEELVYDLQELEELARGSDNWKYKKPGDDLEDEEDDAAANKKGGSVAGGSSVTGGKELEPPEDLTMDELRALVYDSATSEHEMEKNLRKIRHALSKFSHRLLEKKRQADMEEAEMRAKAAREQAAAEAAAAAALEKDLTDSEYESESDEEKPKAPPPPKPKPKPKSDLDMINDEFKKAEEKKSDPEGEVLKEEPTSPENEIPPPSSPSAEPTVAEKIEALKSSHDEVGGEASVVSAMSIPEDKEAAVALQVEQMLAERAAPLGKIKSGTIQALAMQAIWAGYADSEVKVPPPGVIGDDESTKWGTFAFFATLDESTLDSAATPKGRPTESGGEVPLPETMNAREAKRSYMSQVGADRAAFLSSAQEVADREAFLDMQNTTDRMFSARELKHGEEHGDEAKSHEEYVRVQSQPHRSPNPTQPNPTAGT
jgi:hypothetical protein